MNKIIGGLGALALIGGLAACSTSTPAAVPVVHVTVTAPASSAATSAPAAPPQVVINNNPAPSAGMVYIQAPAYAPAAPELTSCGGGTYAGADTSCPFALNVEAAYSGTGGDYAYSPVTGLWYDMTCVDPSADGSVACYGGNNAYVVLGG